MAHKVMLGRPALLARKAHKVLRERRGLRAHRVLQERRGLRGRKDCKGLLVTRGHKALKVQ